MRGLSVQLEPLPEIDLEAIDAELARLARGHGRARLLLGLALAHLDGGYQELGFRTLGAYAGERLSQSGRWAADTRALAKRLRALPRMFAALWRGERSWCAIEVLSRHATPEDEQELLEATHGMSVRAMKAALRERGGGEEEAPSEDERIVCAEVRLPLEDVVLLDQARSLLEAAVGSETGLWFECLLGEATSSLLEVIPPDAKVGVEDVIAAQERYRERRRRGEEIRARKEEEAHRALRARDEGRAVFEDDDDPLALEPLPLDPKQLDARIHALGHTIAMRGLWLGEAAERVLGRRRYRELGWATEEQYCRERLGMSRAAVRSHMRLAREVRWLPELDDAVAHGRIGYESAKLIASVAEGATVKAWVEQAEKRTFKHLRQEVNAVQVLSRWTGDSSPALPPTPAEMARYQAFERDVLSGKTVVEQLGAAARLGGREAIEAIVGITAESQRIREALDEERRSEPSVENVSGGEAGKGDGAAVSSDVVAVQMFGKVSANGTHAAPGDGDVAAAVEELGAVQMFGTSGRGTKGRGRMGYRTVTIRCTEGTLLYFRQLLAVYERAALPGSFLRFAALSAMHSALGELFQLRKYREVHIRDRYECTSPVCTSRNVTCHHVTFRAHGGGEEHGNLTSPCDFCHLEGVHGGRIEVSGRAPHLRWKIGRDGSLVVDGREVLSR